MGLPNPMPAWPPRNGRDFIRSDEFGRILLGIVNQLEGKHRDLDFTDAIASVFDWFDRKLRKNKSFINGTRFKTRGAFVGYLRQAVWNAALRAKRDRQTANSLRRIPLESLDTTGYADPPDGEAILKAIGDLPEPHKSVFERLLMDGESDPAILAGSLNMDLGELFRCYEEATDLVSRSLGVRA